jgi:hypothetical protein
MKLSVILLLLFFTSCQPPSVETPGNEGDIGIVFHTHDTSCQNCFVYHNGKWVEINCYSLKKASGNFDVYQPAKK